MFYRDLAQMQHPGGGTPPVVLIANSTDTVIPGTATVFGSTAPPSAANGQRVVFAGFDNEDAPTLGGIYLAPLEPQPQLTTLVSIGERVPGESRQRDLQRSRRGRRLRRAYRGLLGCLGEETRTVRLYCPTEGNRDRIDYCNQELVCEDTGETLGDPNSHMRPHGLLSGQRGPGASGHLCPRHRRADGRGGEDRCAIR